MEPTVTLSSIEKKHILCEMSQTLYYELCFQLIVYGKHGNRGLTVPNRVEEELVQRLEQRQ